MDLNIYVKKTAKSLGIDLCGLTNYNKFSSQVLDWLQRRKDLGYATEFEEEDLGLRLDKTQALASAQSIIVIGLSYNTGDYSPRTYPSGRLSKVSYGLDYHLVLEEKLRLLAQELLKTQEFSYRIYVDTGPLIDRELAQQAGLGYYGKNCSIINPVYGSYIGLGYMITSLDIEEDQGLDSQCGDCRLCIEACPTGALMEPYRVNPKKCLSYLSQSKEIDPDLSSKLGLRIYGCDTCQEVCPKNKGVELSRHSEFIPTKTQGHVDLAQLLAMTNREFKEVYGDMAGSWRGKNLLKRNALIGLENLGDKAFIPLVEQELENPSSLVRQRARLSLEKLKNKK